MGAQTIVIKNAVEELPRVHGALEELARTRQFAQSAFNDVLVAVEEILVNIIRYGFDDGAEHEIHVRVAYVDDHTLRLEIEDDGKPFNPLTAPTPRTDLGLSERKIGGLGIHLVRTMMDDVQYRREDDHNIVTLAKRVMESDL